MKKKQSVLAVGVCLLLALAAASASITVEEWKDGLLLREIQAKWQEWCPSSCGEQFRHGRCGADGACVCQELWGGQDCSIPVGVLSSGKRVADSVEGGAWKYFVTDTQPGQTVTWGVNSTSGDCDLYVRHDNIPTRQSHDQRDIGLGMSFSVQVVNDQSRRWYAGVHGFLQCNFTITVALTGSGGSGQCPKGCSGHGTCVYGQCQCQEYWGGPDCAMPLTRLNLNQAATKTVNQMEWQYYFFFVNDARALTIQLNQTRSGGDADLFIKFGALPNHTSFDYRDITTAPSAKLVVQPVRASVMYVGVYGFVPTYYSLLVTQENSCPSQCSRHGQCSGTTCRCSYQFSGAVCETMNQPLADDQAVDGYVADGVWNYYHFSSSSLTAVTIEVDQEDGDSSADCDLYVRAGLPPTQTTYDFADVSYSRQMTVTIPQPQFNTWYVGIYGSQRCAYQVRQYMATSCIEGCTPPYGTCTAENTCYCNPGWSGENCHIPVQPLGVGQTVEGALGPNQMQYYAFNASSALATIGLLDVESWASGYYWLFVGIEMVPDLQNFDYSNKETNTPYHQIDIPLGGDGPLTLYIGVYGSPFDLIGPDHPPAHFKLTAWQSPF